MSVLFGLWQPGGAAPRDLADVKAALAFYRSEGMAEYTDREADLLYLPFHVTRESRDEKQPLRMSSGSRLLWDGRLDNREEVSGSLETGLPGDRTDAGVVSAALDRWGIPALAKLTGDWALSVWNPRERTVLLARDFLGTRPLYYVNRGHSLAWSTVIDPLLLPERRPFEIEEEYLAGWLSHFPATHLTPFAGIHSVPPSSYVLLRPGSTTVRKYWDFDGSRTISYRDDREYEEHFRAAFRESVRRRLRSSSPVLAELSGGMDSSSIVCMADSLAADGSPDLPRLDTISYFDDSEPNWNEAPFFRTVEEQRGRAGHHVSLRFSDHWHPEFDPRFFAGTPGSGINLRENADYAAYLESGGYRVLLQGIGGDEVLGGLPTALPELADLLRSGCVRAFPARWMAWALASRTPALFLLGETLRLFLPTRFSGDGLEPPKWLAPQFVKHNARALGGYARRWRVFGPRPSFQANMAALDALRRQIGSTGPSPKHAMERRYPYLDRDLLEFLYAVPREQMVRPNERRSLMRRALRGIVPGQILERRRKAFIARAPVVSLNTELPCLLRKASEMITDSAGIVDSRTFRECLKEAAAGGELRVVALLRTLLVEAWLAHLVSWTRSPDHVDVQIGSRPLRSDGIVRRAQGFFS